MLLEMEGVILERATVTGVNVSETEHSPWSVRKILILVSLFLVYFDVLAAYSVYTPFFPSEVSITVIRLNMAFYTRKYLKTSSNPRLKECVRYLTQHKFGFGGLFVSI